MPPSPGHRLHRCTTAEVENRVHHVRDTTLDEDRSQIRTGNAPRGTPGLRNLASQSHRPTGRTPTTSNSTPVRKCDAQPGSPCRSRGGAVAGPRVGARGWYLQRGIAELPEALCNLPPLVDIDV
ncbi:hypothetical protein ACFRCW_33085 [Streptomyces sp. NPDC056653]|uniref:hypothetical protein n=1 Tax=unclassified Streptomyces TaxID=2593676 RepID=UPI0033A78BA5